MPSKPKSDASQTNVRLPAILRRALVAAAKKERRTLSAEITIRLEASMRDVRL